MPGFSQRTILFAYALAAASFCLLFGGDAGTFAVTFVIGLLVQAVLPLFAQIPMGALFANFVGGLMTAILAQGIHAFIPYGSANAAIIGGIMPLLSGLAMTTAVRDTVYGDLISGMTRALEALLLAVAAALGVYVGLKFAAMMEGESRCEFAQDASGCRFGLRSAARWAMPIFSMRQKRPSCPRRLSGCSAIWRMCFWAWRVWVQCRRISFQPFWFPWSAKSRRA